MGLKQFLRRSQSTSAIHKSIAHEDASRTTAASERSAYTELELLALDQRWNACLQYVREQYTTSLLPLHTLLAQKAPVAIVDACCIMLLDHGVMIPEEMVDAMGRTPLHIATECGCTVQVAERLLAGASMVMPAVTKDERGRYPLHGLCAASYERKGRWQRMDPMDKWNKRQVLTLLLELDPAGAAVTDVNGKTPLDYAKMNDLGTLIVQDLEKVSPMDHDDDMEVRSACHDVMRELSCRRMHHDDVSTIGCVDVEDGIDPFAGMKFPDIIVEQDEPPQVLPPLMEMAESSCCSTPPASPEQKQKDTVPILEDDDFGMVEC